MQKVENLVDENKELKEIIELKNKDIRELEKSNKVKKETVVKLKSNICERNWEKKIKLVLN